MLGVRLAFALLGIFFYIWNEKREPYFVNEPVVKNMREYSFFSSNVRKTAKTELFGIGPSDRTIMISTDLSIDESLPERFCLAEDVEDENYSSDERVTDKKSSITDTETFDALKKALLWQTLEYFQPCEL